MDPRYPWMAYLCGVLGCCQETLCAGGAAGPQQPHRYRAAGRLVGCPPRFGHPACHHPLL
jgi:hypothetical protein